MEFPRQGGQDAGRCDEREGPDGLTTNGLQSEEGLARIFHTPGRASVRSAGFQPASALDCSDRLPIGNRRYSRLEICATETCRPSHGLLSNRAGLPEPFSQSDDLLGHAIKPHRQVRGLGVDEIHLPIRQRNRGEAPPTSALQGRGGLDSKGSGRLPAEGPVHLTIGESD